MTVARMEEPDTIPYSSKKIRINGNGPFGFDWDLSLPSISRKTDRVRYLHFDLVDSDGSILSGAEDLVPVCPRAGW
ncbi:hypothetical protein AWB81_08117 [Caballeronia arationis]|uniref:SpvB/TcaC N-terminal domain-containing protein n=1 Tax=Caballeronia arationis TaxID=1777142 RepID=UPI00074B964F|nr:hypothetical protein AWB81_08117 [Caballeronia arationis]